MLRIFAFSVALIALAFTFLPSDVSAQTKAPSGDVQNGKRIYTKYGCYECHGREGQGASATGPRLGPNPIAYARFLSYIRQPTGDMPPYTAKVVTDQEVADMYAFLQSLPRPPEVKNVPLLNEK
jgi:ubiquinol-cytochrome c reductase cytochrome c subunit